MQVLLSQIAALFPRTAPELLSPAILGPAVAALVGIIAICLVRLWRESNR